MLISSNLRYIRKGLTGVALNLEKYRELPEADIGIRVKSEDGRKGTLSIWYDLSSFLPDMTTISPGLTSRTLSASMRSSAHVSEART